MFVTRFVSAGIAILAVIGPNGAMSYTVHDLVKYCLSEIDNPDSSYCLGVMAGAEDMTILASSYELLQQAQQDTFPLPNDPQTGKPFTPFTDPRLAILAIDKDIMRLSQFTAGPGGEIAHEKIMALRDWRDRIGRSLEPRGISSGYPALDICFGKPPPAPGDLADVFVTWAKANPGANNWDEALGLTAAFRTRWPCAPTGH